MHRVVLRAWRRVAAGARVVQPGVRGAGHPHAASVVLRKVVPAAAALRVVGGALRVVRDAAGAVASAGVAVHRRRPVPAPRVVHRVRRVRVLVVRMLARVSMRVLAPVVPPVITVRRRCVLLMRHRAVVRALLRL